MNESWFPVDLEAIIVDTADQWGTTIRVTKIDAENNPIEFTAALGDQPPKVWTDVNEFNKAVDLMNGAKYDLLGDSGTLHWSLNIPMGYVHWQAVTDLRDKNPEDFCYDAWSLKFHIWMNREDIESKRKKEKSEPPIPSIIIPKPEVDAQGRPSMLRLLRDTKLKMVSQNPDPPLPKNYNSKNARKRTTTPAVKKEKEEVIGVDLFFEWFKKKQTEGIYSEDVTAEGVWKNMRTLPLNKTDKDCKRYWDDRAYKQNAANSKKPVITKMEDGTTRIIEPRDEIDIKETPTRDDLAKSLCHKYANCAVNPLSVPIAEWNRDLLVAWFRRNCRDANKDYVVLCDIKKKCRVQTHFNRYLCVVSNGIKEESGGFSGTELWLDAVDLYENIQYRRVILKFEATLKTNALKSIDDFKHRTQSRGVEENILTLAIRQIMHYLWRLDVELCKEEPVLPSKISRLLNIPLSLVKEQIANPSKFEIGDNNNDDDGDSIFPEDKLFDDWMKVERALLPVESEDEQLNALMRAGKIHETENAFFMSMEKAMRQLSMKTNGMTD